MTEKDTLLNKIYELLTDTDRFAVLIEKFILFTVRAIIAVLVFMVCRKIIKILMKKYDQLNGKDSNKSLQTFSRSILKLSLNFAAIMIALLIMGVKQTAFVGLLGGAVLGIGLALKDTLANFAGGIIIIVFKAYEIGDFIEIDGQGGSVHGINVFATTLNTIDNKRVLVPNGLAASHQIINYTKNKMRRVDLLFGISYDDDFKKAIKILTEISESHPKISQQIDKTIRLRELANSSVNLTFRVWCKSEDYWEVYYDVMESAKLKFDENNITIPFPQMDVHMHKTEIIDK
ncbi:MULTISPECIES: mechanosensitive ion channel family protein [Psychrilyobacter]|uniref:Mechanosensitive ion channel family protein n=1 Tax=Psychrilyobacter piezotolerans TaxID=2293438 RepID=A0ABX9KJT4_9FUSO|nr:MULTISPECIES: mechanosensitive ion channel domain-containing protein [Psychrilyobacter]MCS5423077.1 mechanosensitive ion channel [Psychrilyobacter sp. S5]NDI77073.1 mechanosensitive ion channel [Psychrilyobacter piezotolerans]RDE64689.1 mechanosensitive ion channel family protein [Psychrilyobacter sp. S5]REI42501.1 mechanosensitive ion channel family protein [Psychrilyobacter piezotolerans]